MKKLGLIGFPLSHSFSQKYFNNKFSKENIPGFQYLHFQIENIDQLKEILIQNPDLIGLNVTVPYKREVISFLDDMDPIALEVGAVNTIKISKKQDTFYLKGFNTDIIGFERSLLPLLQEHHKNALILGTGGAAGAVAYVLKKFNIDYKFVSRNKEKKFLHYSDLTEETIRKNKLIINTTPVGTTPRTEEYPEIPYFAITSDHLLYDLIYNPAETQFLRKGKKREAIVKNGLQMLEIQAEESWKIWMVKQIN
ncbi:MAG: shikimate dehydrogenase family protein [Bacteroidia bacterium]